MDEYNPHIGNQQQFEILIQLYLKRSYITITVADRSLIYNFQTFFKILSKPLCPTGNFLLQYIGQMIQIFWKKTIKARNVFFMYLPVHYYQDCVTLEKTSLNQGCTYTRFYLLIKTPTHSTGIQSYIRLYYTHTHIYIYIQFSFYIENVMLYVPLEA